MSAAKRKLFGTDGIRGIAYQYPMTCEVALALGRAVAYHALKGSHRHRVVIGKDTRLSGYMLEMAFASGVCSMGVDALLVGPLPTPALAFLTKDMRADAGVVISASHNVYEDNGIKLFGRDGFKLPDDEEAELERLLDDAEVGGVRPTRAAVGKAFRIDDAAGRYIGHVKRAFPDALDLTGLTIVIDCAHGAAYKVAPIVLQELGAKVVSLGVSPDGRNINRKVGALHPEGVAAAVRKHQAHAGLALDGDADRVIAVDERGAVVDGDVMLALAAESLNASGQLRHRTLVTTVMSNLALDNYLKTRGIAVVRTKVGDRYVVEQMRANDFALGGEPSGHIIYADHASTGDGLVAGLKLLATVKQSGEPLSRLARRLALNPQVMVNVPVKRRIPFEELPTFQARQRSIEDQLGDSGRVVVRYSGTELLARVLVEGPNRDDVERFSVELAAELSAVLR